MYNLQEVWVPEQHHIEEKYHKLPKCNIFMSLGFYRPKILKKR